ncbi:hypothetical protein PPL_09775 [Heterostelium album PN500]|uniref:ZZ-type domain-containing protein n=1 Tax=Heterostelium pallidum (strain ATCC 26659 / Pp 5 / PN500) TaxID=670386 RepID=D3BP13_HETP5|nr:hypothetical protein PPL_09775 [Heterostelium album PN500]EFA77023.1 hypothetical protein PPL_09775 [Heterostelium album PN500]|eukprot:XP_020429153.1 hypothetical protein PPL_09775 [Heterostelium album PN500]
MINNNFDKNCKVCSNTIISGQERYVCSECIDLTICLECYPKSHSISVHTDTAPLPHYCTIEKYVNQEYFLRHRADTLFQTSLNVFETFKNRLCLGHLDAKSPMKSSEMKIKWLTYQDVYESATKFGTSLLKIVPQVILI